MKVLHRSSQGTVLVYELEPTIVNEGPRLLVFESMKTTARLEHFPDDWRKLGDDELIALSRGQS